ncbi:MAG: hypothetical protein ACM3PU_02485, partial [Gemmatimonadota bacterium]
MTRAFELSRTLISLAVLGAFALGAPAVLAQGKGGGGKGGGGETTATNNLSYPALDLDVTTLPVSYFFSIATNPVPTLGQTYSYGCDRKETVGTTEYPNTSCVSA